MSGIAFAEDMLKKIPSILDLFAKPTENHDTTLNSYNQAWKILKNGGLFGKVVFFSLRMLFKEDYISSPSKCKFKPPLFTCVTSLCDWLLDKQEDWKPFIMTKKTVLGISGIAESVHGQRPCPGWGMQSAAKTDSGTHW